MKEQRSTIRQEIKQTRPFRSTAQEAVLSLVRTVGAVMYEYERVAQSEGITFQQYNVLRILRGAGEPLPTMEIGERLLQKTPGVSRTLDRLEKRGLIRRARGRDDGRQVLCALTHAGLRIVDRLDAPVDTLDAASMAPLGDSGQRQIIRLLQKIRDGLRLEGRS
jgi:DNA-binding MarR family transcriptional regulator